MRQLMGRIACALIGKRAATLLRLYRPPHVSDGNMVVHSWIESVDRNKMPTPPISADMACENCGHGFGITIVDPDDFEDGMLSSIYCVKCQYHNVFHFDAKSKKLVRGFPV